MPLPAIYPIAAFAIGAYNTIQAGRERSKMRKQMKPYLDLIMQTAKGGGPLVESAVGGITRAGERGAQRAARSAMAGGRENRPLAMTLANQQRIAASRGGAQVSGQLRAAALQPGLAASYMDVMSGWQEGRAETGSTGMGLGMLQFMRMMEQTRQPPVQGGPMPAIPDYQFQIPLPGASRGRRGLYNPANVTFGRGG